MENKSNPSRRFQSPGSLMHSRRLAGMNKGFVPHNRFALRGLGISAAIFSTLCLMQMPEECGAVGISFSTLTGTNLAAFTGTTQGSFTATPTSGDWFQATFYGSPSPSIFLGPVNHPGIGSILVTDSAGRFTFGGMSFSSNNGDSTYEILGYNGAKNVFDQTGILAGTFGPFSFSSLFSMDNTIAMDALVIEIIPGANVTSVNLDNIDVTTLISPAGSSTPETTPTLILFGSVFLGLGCIRAKIGAHNC